MNIYKFFKSKIRSAFHNSEWANNLKPIADGNVHHIAEDDSNGFYVAKKWTYNSVEYGYIAIMNFIDNEQIEEFSDAKHLNNFDFDNHWLECRNIFKQSVSSIQSRDASETNVQDEPIKTDQHIDITTKYKKELGSAIKVFSKANSSLDNVGEKIENSLFDIAKILVSAKKELGTGRENKKKFTQLKEFTTEKLGNKSIGNMNKAIKVASDARIATHQDKLPNRFSVLYALTSLEDEPFNQLLQDDEISPSITRERLLGKVKQIKGDAKPKPIRFIIKPSEKLTEISDDKLEKLKESLKSIGWEVIAK